MPKFDRFLIAPSNTGLQTDLKPWLIPDDAFTQLQNAYVWRGRVKKRFGSRFMGTGWATLQEQQLYSRLNLQVGTTTAGASSGTVPGVVFKIGQQFSVLGVVAAVNVQFIFTVYQLGAPAAMLSTNSAASGTFNTTTGAWTITGTGAPDTTPVYWYPAESVMGLTNYAPGESINNQQCYAWDTQFSYTFSGSGFWSHTPSTTTAIWHNPTPFNYLNFFWSCNWQTINNYPQIMFTTNYQVTNYDGAATATDDPIWYYNGAAVGGATWTPAVGVNGFYFRPAGGAPYSGPFVQTARLIVVFRNRLMLLNTVENSGLTSGASLGNTDGFGNKSGTTAGGIIGQYFQIGTTYFTIINPTGALQVSAGGTGTGTYNTLNGDWTFVGASAVTAIYLFSTVGTNTACGNRVRWCHWGSPLAINAWYEPGQTDNASPANVGDGGNYLDASTEEEIISCEFIKDRLIVYFERSTYELAYTGNQVKPFTWQKINTELGSESQFSTVPFDKEVITIGNTGVHSCNGSNVVRIDNKIPDQVFQFSNKNIGVQRIAGIRDYFSEMVYWAFPADNENNLDTYPNQVLVYNYKNGAWALNDDCITMFGYFEQESGLTWENISWQWQQWNASWDSGYIQQATSRQVIAGNQEGFVFIVDTEISRNERAMQITNLTYPSPGIIQLVIVDHTLDVGDYITIENPSGAVISTPVNYKVLGPIIDANTIQVADPLFPGSSISGVYTGGGNAARVSKIQILSKQWNPYIDKDRNFFLQRIDFGVTSTTYGQITVDYYPSASEMSLINTGGPLGTGAMLGNSILETSPYPVALAPLEQEQELLWHPVYFQTDGTMIQIYMYFSDAQMNNQNITFDFFEMQGLTLFCQPTTARLQ